MKKDQRTLKDKATDLFKGIGIGTLGGSIMLLGGGLLAGGKKSPKKDDQNINLVDHHTIAANPPPDIYGRIGPATLTAQTPAAPASAPTAQTASTRISADDLRTLLANDIQGREGCRTDVYKDSMDRLTVGIGHLVRAKDHLKLHDEITPDCVQKFAAEDTRIACRAACGMADRLGVTDTDFILALSKVNFQLGPGWYKEHKNTWSLIEQQKYREAADEAARSKWAKQTPVRVEDFQKSLNDYAAKREAATQPAGPQSRANYSLYTARTSAA